MIVKVTFYSTSSSNKMETKDSILNVLVVGCLHGCWKTLYEEVTKRENIDLVLVNGDCETFRNEEDYFSSTNATDEKGDVEIRKAKIKEEWEKRNGDTNLEDIFKEMNDVYGTFKLFYEKKLTFPCLVIIIGGNHENNALFSKLPHGGFIAENIYYLGRAGIVDYKGIRICGYSGVYSSKNYVKPFPNDFKTVNDRKSGMHVREYSQLQIFLYSVFEEAGSSTHPEFLMTHDWPQDIKTILDDRPLPNQIIKFIIRNCAPRGGLPLGGLIMKSINTRYAIAAHHHIKFEFSVKGTKETDFIALSRPDVHKEDWCKLIKIEDVEAKETGNKLTYAPEWIAILKETKKKHLDFPTKIGNENWINIKNQMSAGLIGALKEVNGLDLTVVPYNPNPEEITHEFCRRFML